MSDGEDAACSSVASEPQYIGLRCTADEYLQLDDDRFCYHLIDGVVVWVPRPALNHQRVLASSIVQMDGHLRSGGRGESFPRIDVRLSERLVYAADLVYIAAGRSFPLDKPLAIIPDLIVEIVSPCSYRLDFQTKRSDYERFGVREYWIVEPAEKRVRVLRLADGKYVETIESGDTAPSQVIPGFAFDLVALRKVMEA